MTIELRPQDRIRARLGLPRYPKVEGLGRIELRHDPRDPVLDPYGPNWLWRHDTWPTWQWFQLPVKPYHANSFDEVEALLREAIARWDRGFYVSLRRAGKRGRLRSPC